MREIRFVSASGGLGGNGVDEAALEEATRGEVGFIAADAGSTDLGPYFLGSGRHEYARSSIKRDLKLMLAAGRRTGAPVIVGSAGMGGGDIQVDELLGIAQEVMAELGGRMRTAVIRAEQDRDYLKSMLAAGRIRPLDPAPHFDAAVIDRSAHIVGMMGVEPIQAALRDGAEFVLAGRCSDAALFAALPVMQGFPAGLAWHAGKILECNTAACVVKGKGVMTATLGGADLVITPVGKGLRCTPHSVAAHGLYENTDPYLHRECSGTLDLTHSRIEPVDDISVRIRGSQFHPAEEYSVKLEGAELVGHQTLAIFGIRDPYIIAELDSWLAEIAAVVHDRIGQLFPEVGRETYHIRFRVYGRDAVMGALEPRRHELPHEVGVVMEVTAPTQALATDFVKLSRQPLLHQPVAKWTGFITGVAMLGTPGYLERGPVYRFNVNHVVLPRDPLEMFRTSFVDLGQ